MQAGKTEDFEKLEFSYHYNRFIDA